MAPRAVPPAPPPPPAAPSGCRVYGGRGLLHAAPGGCRSPGGRGPLPGLGWSRTRQRREQRRRRLARLVRAVAGLVPAAHAVQVEPTVETEEPRTQAETDERGVTSHEQEVELGMEVPGPVAQEESVHVPAITPEDRQMAEVPAPMTQAVQVPKIIPQERIHEQVAEQVVHAQENAAHTPTVIQLEHNPHVVDAVDVGRQTVGETVHLPVRKQHESPMHVEVPRLLVADEENAMYETAVTHRDVGNKLVQAKRYQLATDRCYEAIDTLNGIDDECEEVRVLRATVYLNLSMCHVKGEHWEAVVETATCALQGDRRVPDPLDDVLPPEKKAKALFRRATAHDEGFGNYEPAREDLRRARVYAPGDTSIEALFRKYDLAAKKEATAADRKLAGFLRKS